MIRTFQWKQTHRHRKQSSGLQWGEGSGDGQERSRELRGTREVKVAQLCPTLRDPMDCIGMLQARILECLPFPSPGDLPNPRIKPRFDPAGGFFTS